MKMRQEAVAKTPEATWVDAVLSLAKGASVVAGLSTDPERRRRMSEADVIARVTLYPTAEGGRRGPTPDQWFGCPFGVNGEWFD